MQPSVVQSIESVPQVLLGPLLDEEAAMWADDLRWSFAPSRQRLEAALLEGTVHGFVAMDEIGACAYATFSSHEDQGVIGSFFSSKRARNLGLEEVLIRRILARLLDRPPRVVDCQTLFSSKPSLKEPFATCGFESAARLYMSLERDTWAARATAAASPYRSKPTHRTDIRSIARLIFDAHERSRFQDASSSFDTLDSCARILRQIILDEVCGAFDSAGSRRIEEGGRALAACLLTWPLPGVAHVSEVATAPGERRKGLARHCLIESLRSAFERGGATQATLSVTASNQAALGLYESIGFVPKVSYQSHVLRSPLR